MALEHRACPSYENASSSRGRRSERVLSRSSDSLQPLLRQKPKQPVMQQSMLEQHQARLIHRGPTLGTLVNLRITSNRNP